MIMFRRAFPFSITASVMCLGVLLLAARASGQSAVIINEIDYDQPGQDFGEFIELKNVSQKTIDLSEYSIELVNGANYPNVANYLELSFETSKPQIVPGGYFVLCQHVDNTTLTDAQCNAPSPMTAFQIQNGARDAVRLLKNGTVVDMVTYDGFMDGYAEGTAGAPKDRDTKDDYSISRTPDGLDTDANDFDFKWTCASPGRANYTDAECACLQMVCTGNQVCNPETGLCETPVVQPDVIEDTGSPDASQADTAVTVDSGADQGAATDTQIGDSTTGTDQGGLVDSNQKDTSIPYDQGGSETGPGIDMMMWLDLPVVAQPDQDGVGDEDGSGCSAGSTSAGVLPILLLSALSILMLRYLVRRNRCRTSPRQ